MRMRPSNNGRPEGALRPEDFPLGSPESRAAARMLVDCRKEQCRRIEIVTNACFPDHDAPPRDRSRPYATPWRGTRDCLMRMLYVPNGMSQEEAQRIADIASDSEVNL
jgi:hypothetical protein